jgi:hypothetical protein
LIRSAFWCVSDCWWPTMSSVIRPPACSSGPAGYF